MSDSWLQRTWDRVLGREQKAPKHFDFEVDVTDIETKSLTPSDTLPMSWSGQPVWKQWDTDEAIKTGLKGSTAVFACISKTARNVSSMRWRAEEKIAGEWELGDRTPVAEHIRRPNEFMSWNNLVYRFVQHIMLSGNGIIDGARRLGNPNAPIIELWPHNPARIDAIPSKTDIISHYVYTQEDGVKKNIPTRDICHLMAPDPGCIYWGLSPLQAAARAVDIDREAANWQKTTLQNLMVPPLIIGVGGTRPEERATKAQIKRVRKLIDTDYAGADNARKAMILGQVKNVWKASFTPVEMDFLGSRKEPQKEICAIYGAPHMAIFSPEDSTFANSREARSMWWEDTLVPFAEEIAQAFTLYFQREYGGDVRVVAEAGHMPAVVDRLAGRAEAAYTYWKMGYSANEVNERLGLQMPRLDHDRRYIEASMMELGPGGALPGESFDDDA